MTGNHTSGRASVEGVATYVPDFDGAVSGSRGQEEGLGQMPLQRQHQAAVAHDLERDIGKGVRTTPENIRLSCLPSSAVAMSSHSPNPLTLTRGPAGFRRSQTCTEPFSQTAAKRCAWWGLNCTSRTLSDRGWKVAWQLKARPRRSQSLMVVSCKDSWHIRMLRARFTRAAARERRPRGKTVLRFFQTPSLRRRSEVVSGGCLGTDLRGRDEEVLLLRVPVDAVDGAGVRRDDALLGGTPVA